MTHWSIEQTRLECLVEFLHGYSPDFQFFYRFPQLFHRFPQLFPTDVDRGLVQV